MFETEVLFSSKLHHQMQGGATISCISLGLGGVLLDFFSSLFKIGHSFKCVFHSFHPEVWIPVSQSLTCFGKKQKSTSF